MSAHSLPDMELDVRDKHHISVLCFLLQLCVYIMSKTLFLFIIEYQYKGNTKFMYYKMNSIYTLKDPDNSSNIFHIDGSSILYFNDNTNGTLYNTYESVRKNKSASKCYFIDHNKMWYQLIYKEQSIFQYSFNGSLIRRIEHVQQISDEQIRELIKIDVHSGTPSTEAMPNPIYDKWEKGLLTVLDNGSISVDTIKRIIYNTDNIPNPQYLGGRWLMSFLQGFTNKYPKYKELIL